MRALALLFVSCLLVGGCGQKGALLLPDKKPKTTVTSPPPTPPAAENDVAG